MKEDAWSGRWDLNPRPSAWQADVLPLNYARPLVPFSRAARLKLAESPGTVNRQELPLSRAVRGYPLAPRPPGQRGANPGERTRQDRDGAPGVPILRNIGRETFLWISPSTAPPGRSGVALMVATRNSLPAARPPREGSPEMGEEPKERGHAPKGHVPDDRPEGYFARLIWTSLPMSTMSRAPRILIVEVAPRTSMMMALAMASRGRFGLARW